MQKSPQCLVCLSVGSTLSASGESTPALLLPGQYTSSTNPELLHDLLTSSSASLSPSAGFANSSSQSSVSLPLTVALQPGIAVYPQSFYSGQGSYTGLPSSPIANASTLSASSLALSGNVWAEVSAGSNSRVILWNSIPDASQLPQTASGSLSLLNLQSTACSPPCSGNGVCSASGTCVCPTGFNGTSCESCASGYYGPTCKACPSGCTSCDDGITGTGRCLTSTVTNPPSSCNCINGQCGVNGQCSCLPGWTSASNGTQCAACASGFFLDSNGNCESEHTWSVLRYVSLTSLQFVRLVALSAQMDLVTAYLASLVILRMPMTLRAVMPLSKRLPAGMRALPLPTAPGLLAKRALPSVSHVQDPRRTTVFNVLLVHIYSTVLACRRTAAVFARVQLFLPIMSRTSVTVSILLLYS